MSMVEKRFHFRNRAVLRAPPRVLLASVLAALALAPASALAQNTPRAESLIKWRQSAYQVVAWNSGRQFLKVAQTCKSCHNQFRHTD
jgi:predicted CxxxxCH...CXXCH cytochrome family protein